MLGLGEYREALARGLRGDMTDHGAHLLPFLALATFALWLHRGRGGASARRPAAVLLIAIWCATGLRFLALPLLADRMFAPAYVATLGVACGLLFRARAEQRSGAARPY